MRWNLSVSTSASAFCMLLTWSPIIIHGVGKRWMHRVWITILSKETYNWWCLRALYNSHRAEVHLTNRQFGIQIRQDYHHIPKSPDHITGTTVITNLCSTIAATNPAENVFGLLKGEEESYILERRANLQPPRKTYQTVSLESLLNKTSDLSLSRRQRYQIGFTLASSHLQLYPSPWLHSQWSKREIIFKIDPQDHRSIQTDQPYILRSVSTSTQQSATTPTPSYASSDRCLPTLGILLIELCFGTALEDHEMRRQYDSTSAEQQQQQQIATADLAAALDLAVALEWARFVGGEAGEGYADAVGWCLRGQCGGLTRDDRWREELFANVVRPLMSCHEQMRSVGKGGVA